MLNKLIFVFFITLAPLLGYCQTMPRLFGKVKSETKYQYQKPVSGDSIICGWEGKFVYESTIDDRQQTLKIYNRNNQLILCYVMTFDKKGREINTKDSAGKAYDKVTYKTDHKGRTIVKTYMGGTNPLFIDTFNSEGKLIGRVTYRRGKPNERTAYHFDKIRNTTKESHFDMQGHLSGEESRTYDQDDRVIIELGFYLMPNDTSKKYYKSSYQYDQFGNAIVQTDSAKITVDSYFVPDKSRSHGEISVKIIQYGNFDSYNNWRRMDVMNEDKIVKTTLRRIEYFSDKK